MSASRVSSPASTGGAGTFFEQHVGAYWLAQLLVGGIPPILIDTIVTEVHFQTERLGWHTDDFLIVCDRTGAASRKLAGQVKRNFTVSAADDECRKAIGDFWRDFKNGDRFSLLDDRLVLVTLRGTATLLEHFVGLLDCARAARDGTEFEQRLATDGFISDKAVQYCRELQTIIGDLEGKPVTAAEIWPFLRVLHVLNLDLHSSTRQAEAHIKSQLAHTMTEGDAVSAAAASWNELVGVASSAMAEARSLRRTDLPAALQERHTRIGTNDQRVLRALKDHTGLILRAIRSTIGPDCHVERAALVQKVLAALEDAQVVLVVGPAGSGKSAIGKDAVTVLSEDHFTFGFRVEEFAQPHFDATLNAAQVPANATTLGAILAAQDRKLILVESVERLLEKTTRDAFSDLMTLAADDGGIRIVLTCRDYSVEQVRASFLQPARIKHAVIRVPPLDDAELTQAEAANPALAIPLKNRTLRNILRNPFFLDKALEISWFAWATVLMLVHRNLASFTRQERGLLLGLIEDAVRNVSWCAPELEGAEFKAGIAHWLLDGLQGYGGEEPRKRVLKVIAKIPKADAARFEGVLRGHIRDGERRDRVADDLRELIYTGIDGMPAARDLPDLIVSVGADYLLASDADIRYSRSPLDLDLYFGIKEGRRHDSYPASAMHASAALSPA